MSDEAILKVDGKDVLLALMEKLRGLNDFTAESIEATALTLAEAQGLKLGAVAQPLRAALTGSTVSPPIFEVAAILGMDETVKRIEKAV